LGSAIEIGGLVDRSPALIGIFWGAPLITRELETGTNRLAWTKSITRARRLAVKLALAGQAPPPDESGQRRLRSQRIRVGRPETAVYHRGHGR
jgi:hypothetical protein